MFYKDVTVFNQPLTWDTSRATNMACKLLPSECTKCVLADVFVSGLICVLSDVCVAADMFSEASAFDQPLEWNTSGVTTFNGER